MTSVVPEPFKMSHLILLLIFTTLTSTTSGQTCPAPEDSVSRMLLTPEVDQLTARTLRLVEGQNFTTAVNLLDRLFNPSAFWNLVGIGVANTAYRTWGFLVAGKLRLM